MVTKRILLFGGSGQVGQTLKAQVPPDWQLFSPTRAECDLRSQNSIVKAMRDFQPELVINAAALTNIEVCETDRDLAMAVNFNAVATMSSICVECDAPLVQLSTDYVFDGNDGNIPYVPDSPMNPLNVYGESKLMGEEAARHGSYWHVIVRTSLVFSDIADNVLTKTIRQIETSDEVTAVTDQEANPTSARHLATALVNITETVLSGQANCFGTFHFANTPALNRFEFTRAIMDACERYTKKRPTIRDVKSADIPNRIARPSYSVLDCSKIADVYGIVPQNWDKDLLDFTDKVFGKRAAETRLNSENA